MSDTSNGLDGAAAAFLGELSPSTPERSVKNDETGVRESLFDDNVFEGEGSDEDENDEDGSAEGLDGEEGGGDDVDPEEGEEGDDEGADPDDDEDADGEGEAEEGSVDLSAEVQVTIDGEQVTVPLKEALEGYIRTETFHRRLSVLNEAKQVIATEAAKVVEDRKNYFEKLEELTKQLDLLAPKEPDWDALYAADPANARDMEKRWRDYKVHREALDHEKAKVAQEALENHQKNLRQYVQAESVKLLSKVPEWNDNKVRERENASMRKTALAVGYTEDELKELYDHRAVLVLRKAAAYDRMMANKPAPNKVVGKRPEVAPGTGKPSKATVRKGGDRAMKQLSRTGSVHDAIPVFAKFIK